MEKNRLQLQSRLKNKLESMKELYSCENYFARLDPTEFEGDILVSFTTREIGDRYISNNIIYQEDIIDMESVVPIKSKECIFRFLARDHKHIIQLRTVYMYATRDYDFSYNLMKKNLDLTNEVKQHKKRSTCCICHRNVSIIYKLDFIETQEDDDFCDYLSPKPKQIISEPSKKSNKSKSKKTKKSKSKKTKKSNKKSSEPEESSDDENEDENEDVEEVDTNNDVLEIEEVDTNNDDVLEEVDNVDDVLEIEEVDTNNNVEEVDTNNDVEEVDINMDRYYTYLLHDGNIKITFNIKVVFSTIEKMNIVKMIINLYETNNNFYNHLNCYTHFCIFKQIHEDNTGVHFNAYFYNCISKSHTETMHFYIENEKITNITVIQRIVKSLF